MWFLFAAGDPAEVVKQALYSTDALVALLTLTALEIVLGIDNIVFIAIVAGKLPESERDRARKLGLSFAVATRILLLFAITWIIGLDRVEVVSLLGKSISVKDLVLIVGGLFLMGKATYEIHHKIAAAQETHAESSPVVASVSTAVMQILAVDLVFSLDSVITAVGMTPHIPIMIVAVIVSIGIMLAFSKAIIDFVDRNPTIKILALSFLILIGVLLLAEGFEQRNLLPKGYVYFAMAFSLIVDLLQMWSLKPKGTSISTAKVSGS